MRTMFKAVTITAAFCYGVFCGIALAVIYQFL